MKTPAVIALMAMCCGWMSLSAVSQAPPDIEEVVTQIGERVARYYRRAQSLVSSGTVRRPADLTDLVVGGACAHGRIRAARGIRGLGWREAASGEGDSGRSPDEWTRAEPERQDGPQWLHQSAAPCRTSRSPSVFLPAHRDGYRFTSIRDVEENDSAALVIDYVSTIRKSRPELIEDELGHQDCFDWSGPVATRGRVWVDASTYEVLRVERRIAGPIDVRVPWMLQRRYLLPLSVVVERDNAAIRYKPVSFTDPDEVILLPESSESLTLIRGGLQSVRRSERFSGYRRFLTGGRVVTGREPGAYAGTPTGVTAARSSSPVRIR